MSERIFDAGSGDPMGQYRADLDPNFKGGINDHAVQPNSVVGGGLGSRTVADVKELYNRYHKILTSDQMTQIPIVSTGTHLQQGATYCDLAQSQPREFVAEANRTAKEHEYLAPKSQVSYTIWDYLIGVTNPARLDENPSDNTDRV